MLKTIMRVSLNQGKYKNIFFNMWCWLYSQSNEHNVYYGTIKEIMEATQTDYAKINKALQLQQQWNTPDFEQTIVLRKEESDFIPYHNNHTTKKYFSTFNVNVANLRSQYKPVIIIFNNFPYQQLKEGTHSNSEPLTDAAMAEPAQNQNKRKYQKKNPDVSKQLQDACLDIYIAFYAGRVGVKPKLDHKEGGKQIASLLRIIKYFKANNKDNSDTGIVDTFDLIFSNWDVFSDFYREQFKLNQIESNLPNLLATLKGASGINKSRSSKAEAFSRNFESAINSGALDHKINQLGKGPVHT